MTRPYYFFGANRIFLPRLLGAFLLAAALLMFISASGQMFDTWDTLRKYPECIEKKDEAIDTFAQIQYCKQSLADVTGLHLRPDQARPTTRQFLITLLPPVALLFFWASVFLLGLILYQTGVVRFLPQRPVQKSGPKRAKK